MKYIIVILIVRVFPLSTGLFSLKQLSKILLTPRMVLSERERITLLMMRGYGDLVRSFQEVATLFNTTYPNREPISKSTVQRTVRRFEETGSVKDRQRIGRPKSATNVDNSLEVMQTFAENPHSSCRKAASAHDISMKSIHRILVHEKWHPFKLKITHELTEDDPDRRIQFCEEMMRRYDVDNTFFDHIIFSDEASFQLNGAVNRHNCRYWSDVNPYWVSDLRTQYPQKLNVWAGFCGRGIIGPFFIDGNLNAATYLNLLQNEVVPAIENMFGNTRNIWFQQDGAGPHFAIAVRQFLDNTFPNRWIGRRGQIEWPPRSPDLSPLDYFLWGYLKNNVYATKPTDLANLRERIIHQVGLISADMRRAVLNNFYLRLGHCQAAEGGQFEHLIK